MNIITWEWVLIIGMIVGWLGLLTGCIIHNFTSNEALAIAFAVPCSIILLGAFIFDIPLTLAQSKVEKEYVKYINLKMDYLEAQLTEDPLDDMALELDIQTYNYWYMNNKDKLEDKWHLWGTSSYADKFDWITVNE